MKEKFSILKTGNFYFPYLYSKDKFIVENTTEIFIKGENVELIDFALKKKDYIFLDSIATIIWNCLKIKFKSSMKQYKNCWFVPMRLHKIGKEYACTIDILRKVK